MKVLLGILVGIATFQLYTSFINQKIHSLSFCSVFFVFMFSRFPATARVDIGLAKTTLTVGMNPHDLRSSIASRTYLYFWIFHKCLDKLLIYFALFDILLMFYRQKCMEVHRRSSPFQRFLNLVVSSFSKHSFHELSPPLI